MRCYQVMIAEDKVEVVSELRERLLHEEEIKLVGVARTGIEACDMACKLSPDVILMDIDMPQMNGIEATRRIKRDAPETQIVILTVFDDTPHIFEAIRAGAMSYLIKGCSTEEIVHEVKAVMAGEGSIPPAQVPAILAEFDRIRKQTVESLSHLFESLSKTEFTVLTYVAQGKTNAQIARLLGTERSRSTVSGHITSILKKLHVNSRTEAAQIARQSGLTIVR